ncbi:MAG: aminotransferase class III-fold pyridoxal phosphate-dependent enzyme, partial [Hyphomicrobiales bacterium]
ACAAALDRKIRELGPENVLAFILEPVGGLSTGAVVPPAGYFRAIRDICTRHGVFLVFDEVLCGAGRTGKFVTAHHWPEALPDIVVMAKGIGAGYAPLGAMLAPARMVDELAGLTGFEFSYSYNANPICCAAGIAVLDEFERLNLVERARVQGDTLRRGLEEIQAESAVLGDVRGIGMLLAVEMVADKAMKRSLPSGFQPTERIRVHGLENGIMLYSRPTAGGSYGHWFMIAPPLTITESEIGELLSRTRAAVLGLEREARSAGVL